MEDFKKCRTTTLRSWKEVPWIEKMTVFKASHSFLCLPCPFPLAYVNKPQVVVTSDAHSCGQNGLMTRGEYTERHWNGKCKGLKVSVGFIYGTSLRGFVIVVISHGFHHVTHVSYLGKKMVGCKMEAVPALLPKGNNY